MTAGHHPHTFILTSDGKEDIWKEAMWLQFTGEKDRDGIEIYEDFIVELPIKRHWVATVVFERGCWMIDFGVERNERFTFTRLLSAWAKDCIVTGNIHERS